MEHFFEVAIRDFHHAGSLFPSSVWCAQAILRYLPSPGSALVEYGGGDGTLTEFLLEALPLEGRLWSVEVNSQFVGDLRGIQDPRLTVLHEDVRTRAAKLRELRPEGVDAVISGIPFSFLPSEDRDMVVQRTFEGLRPGGRFIVYQYSPAMRERMGRVFGNCKLSFEPRNIFPLFIMVATKH